MLSVLIPIYNYNCFPLVSELVCQLKEAEIQYEILCYDDYSTLYKEENKKIQDLSHCNYKELTENIGRSRIRNLLVKESAYENLLFLDCDSGIPNPDFIIKYVESIRTNKVVSGGTIYLSNPPENPQYRLHWKHGLKREPKPDNNQNKMFTSNNFIIKRNIIEKYPFDENIRQYGHEDTLFHLQLEKKGIKIKFIDNPVIHLGLEKHAVFISKVKESTETLFYIYQNNMLDRNEIKKIKLLKYHEKLKKAGLTSLTGFLYPLFTKIINLGLLKKYPVLLALDLYKLTYLCKLDTARK